MIDPLEPALRWDLIAGWSVSGIGIAMLFFTLLRRPSFAQREKRRLWHELARNAGLNRIQRRTLIRAAIEAGLSTPSAMLLSRGCFDHAASVLERRIGSVPELAKARAVVFDP